MLARLDGPDGLARLHAGGRACEQANLSDYVWLAQGCLSLGPNWQAKAEELAEGAYQRFETGNGRLALTRDGAPLGPVLEGEDGAVPSGESSALELFAMLDRRTEGAGWREKAALLQNAISGMVAGLPMVRLQAVLGAEILRGGEAGFRRSHAGGALVTDLRRNNGAWQLVLHPGDGWHIADGTNGMVPVLEGAEAALSPEMLAGREIVLDLTVHKNVISLSLQICNETLCLAPLIVTYQVP